MASVTIHALSPELDRRLGEESKRRGLSRNGLVKELLGKALGLSGDRSEDYAEFLGVWSESEGAAFESRLAEHRRIDEGEW